ncbi:DUF4070 domain-containing protein [Methylogaea oryzae]|nr:DUF4070 domain-containing protein [Methylogaea oryzae]
MSWAFTGLLLVKLMRHVESWPLRRFYLKRLANFIKHRPYPMRVFDYVMESICHHHFYRFSQDMAKGRTDIISTM